MNEPVNEMSPRIITDRTTEEAKALAQSLRNRVYLIYREASLVVSTYEYSKLIWVDRGHENNDPMMLHIPWVGDAYLALLLDMLHKFGKYLQQYEKYHQSSPTFFTKMQDIETISREVKLTFDFMNDTVEEARRLLLVSERNDPTGLDMIRVINSFYPPVYSYQWLLRHPIARIGQ